MGWLLLPSAECPTRVALAAATPGSSCSVTTRAAVTTRAGSWHAAQHHCLRHSYCQHPAEQRCLTALSSSTPQAASAQIKPPALAPTAR